MIAKYAPVWEGRLGRMELREHGIFFKAEAKLEEQMPYWQGLVIREKYAEEVKEKLK